MTLKPCYVPSIHGPEGAKVANDWCIVSPQIKQYGFSLAHLVDAFQRRTHNRVFPQGFKLRVPGLSCLELRCPLITFRGLTIKAVKP